MSTDDELYTNAHRYNYTLNHRPVLGGSYGGEQAYLKGKNFVGILLK